MNMIYLCPRKVKINVTTVICNNHVTNEFVAELTEFKVKVQEQGLS